MLVKARRALLSTYDRSGLVEFAHALVDLDIELISTGGTGQTLKDAGLPVCEVATITGFPEIMDGRVKTLHPHIHGGLLARRDSPEHMATLKNHGIEPIDIVCVNLYPFEETISQPGCTLADAIEQIDIGGPTMLRAAAKNNASIYVLSTPTQYAETLKRLRADNGYIDPLYGRQLALEVYRKTAAYDATISTYLAAQI